MRLIGILTHRCLVDRTLKRQQTKNSNSTNHSKVKTNWIRGRKFNFRGMTNTEDATAKSRKQKENKQIDGNFFYSIYVLFHVTHAFDNLLHFPMCFVLFLSSYRCCLRFSKRDRDNIFILLFAAVRWSFSADSFLYGA